VRRSREELVFGVLKSCAFDKLTISQLMISQNLSHNLLESVLKRLTTSNLIEYEKRNGKRLVLTTERGTAVLRVYRNLFALLNGKVAPCPCVAELDQSMHSVIERN